MILTFAPTSSDSSALFLPDREARVGSVSQEKISVI
jgi:hypothetical protein